MLKTLSYSILESLLIQSRKVLMKIIDYDYFNFYYNPNFIDSSA